MQIFQNILLIITKSLCNIEVLINSKMLETGKERIPGVPDCDITERGFDEQVIRRQLVKVNILVKLN